MLCSKCGHELHETDDLYLITHGHVEDAEFVSDEVVAEYRCPKCFHPATRRRPKIMGLQEYLDQQRERLIAETL